MIHALNENTPRFASTVGPVTFIVLIQAFRTLCLLHLTLFRQIVFNISMNKLYLSLVMPDFLLFLSHTTKIQTLFHTTKKK